MNRNKLCKILHLHVKYYQKSYLKILREDVSSKNRDDWENWIKDVSKNFKKTQKVLEYIRKGYDYDYIYNPQRTNFLTKPASITIKTIGRNTWKHMNSYEFEIEIPEQQLKVYESQLVRESKLERILNE